MNDENKSNSSDEGDDLLSDFNDLFPEDDVDSSENMDVDEEPDALESLLDGLEAPEGIEDKEVAEGVDNSFEGSEENAEEISSDSNNKDVEDNPASKATLDLDKNQLDISADGDKKDELDDLISVEDTFIPDARTGSETSTSTPTTDDHPSKEEGGTIETIEKSTKNLLKTGDIVVYLLLFIALSTAAISLWTTFQIRQETGKNEVQLSKLQKRQALILDDLSTPYNPLIEQNSSFIRDLDQRINELLNMIDGNLGRVNKDNPKDKSTESDLRLQQLEQALAALKDELTKRHTATTATTSLSPPPKKQNSTTTTVKLWALNLLSLTNQKAAIDTIKRLQKAGVNATKTHFVAKSGRSWYRVRVTGFSSQTAARSYAKKMPKVQGISQTWVTPE